MRFVSSFTVFAVTLTLTACGEPYSSDAQSVQGATTATTTAASTGSTTPAATTPATTPSTTTTTTTTTPATPGPVSTTPTADPCAGTPAAITYTGQAEAIINTSCAGCHGGKSPNLQGYANAKTGFATGGGTQAVQLGTMPIGSTLTTSEKCILKNWASNNYAE